MMELCRAIKGNSVEGVYHFLNEYFKLVNKNQDYEDICHNIVQLIAQVGCLDNPERKQSIDALMAIREYTYDVVGDFIN